MDRANLKLLIIGMLLGATLLAGGMVFNAFSQLLHNIQIRTTKEGVLLNFNGY
jgi:hypothetical protein